MKLAIYRNEGFFYNNTSAILFVVSILCAISIDTISRYFSLLHVEDLNESGIYSTLRVALVAFLIGSWIFDMKRVRTKELNLLYAFSLLSIISLSINFVDANEFFKACAYTFSFVLIYRYGILLGMVNSTPYPIIISIVFVLMVLLSQFFSTYILDFSNIAIISNDAIFSLVVFVPFLFIVKNKKLMLLLLLAVVICTIFSQKRSVIFFVNLGILIGFYLFFIKRARIVTTILGLAVATLLFYYWDSVANVKVVELAVDRFSTSGDNGRDQIQSALFTNFYAADFSQWMFGRGYYATVNDIGVPSHNDFIEVMYDFGLPAVILYILLVLALGYRCIAWFKDRYLYIDYYLCYTVGFIILIGLSMYNSMVFSIYNVVLFLGLGFSHGRIVKCGK